MSADKLKELREQTVRECAAELQAVLDRHGCSLAAVPEIVDGRIVARIEVRTK